MCRPPDSTQLNWLASFFQFWTFSVELTWVESGALNWPLYAIVKINIYTNTLLIIGDGIEELPTTMCLTLKRGFQDFVLFFLQKAYSATNSAIFQRSVIFYFWIISHVMWAYEALAHRKSPDKWRLDDVAGVPLVAWSCGLKRLQKLMLVIILERCHLGCCIQRQMAFKDAVIWWDRWHGNGSRRV